MTLDSRELSTAVGTRLREARRARGMTQADLAGSDYSAGYISRIESGDRSPGRRVIGILADRLEVSPHFLLTGVDYPKVMGQRHSLDLAELALAGGNAESALAAVAEIIEAGPADAEVARRAGMVRALALETQGDLHAAIIELEDLYAAEATSEVGIALSRCYRETDEYARAIEVGEHVLDLLAERGLAGTTEHVRLAVTVAAAYFESGQTGVAIRNARRAIKIADELGYPEAQAAAYWNASNFEYAAGHIDRTIRLAARALAMLENGDSTRNLARLRSQLAHYHLRSDHPDLGEARRLLTLAAEELRWSSAGPLNVARNRLGFARLHLLEGDPAAARAALAEISMSVAEQDSVVAAEARVLELHCAVSAGEPIEGAYGDVSDLLTLLGSRRGVPQLWFEVGEALATAGDLRRSNRAFREAARGFGAARLVVPTRDRPADALAAVLGGGSRQLR